MKKSIKKKIISAIMAVAVLTFIPPSGAKPVSAAPTVLNPASVEAGDDNTYYVEKYYVNFEYAVNNTGITCEQKMPIFLKDTESVWFEKPKVMGCSYCQTECDSHTAYKTQIPIEKNNGTVITSYGYKLMNLASDFDYGYVCLMITHNPGRVCPNCGRQIGWVIRADTMYVQKRIITFNSHPSSVTVSSSRTAQMNVNAKYDGTYKWVTKVNGNWVELSDSSSLFGEKYSGTNTSTLSISNITSDLSNHEYACKLVGYRGNPVYSNSAYVYVPFDTSTPTPTPTQVPTQIPTQVPTQVPTQIPTQIPTQVPTQIPTQVPTQVPTQIPTQVPTQIPTQIPTQTPGAIIPGPGSATDYRPASSSSVLTNPSETGGGTNSGGTAAASSSSTSKISNTSSKDDNQYKGDINVNIPVSSDPGTAFSATPGKATGGSSDSNGGTGKNGTGKNGGKPAAKNNSNGSSKNGESDTTKKETASKSTGSKLAGSRTIMKDGVLYVIGDESDEPILSPSNVSDDTTAKEDTEEEIEYAASDLALEGQIQEKEQEKGFWESPAGYGAIIGIAILILLIAMFFLFFGVIVFAEAEEHDEVFELCSVRLMRKREGNWHVNLGNAFDDNAVVRLRIGILFAVVFDGWEITGDVKGMYEGSVTQQAEQNMMFYRKNIRRSV